MAKKLIIVFVLICFCTPLFASPDMSKAEPYKEGEFPKWALDLRRTEVIFMGALPVAFIAADTIMGDGASFSNALIAAASAAAVITIADIILGLFE